jgi:hypothetical protein
VCHSVFEMWEELKQQQGFVNTSSVQCLNAHRNEKARRGMSEGESEMTDAPKQQCDIVMMSPVQHAALSRGCINGRMKRAASNHEATDRWLSHCSA